jgi:hypothetical protein
MHAKRRQWFQTAQFPGSHAGGVVQQGTGASTAVRSAFGGGGRGRGLAGHPRHLPRRRGECRCGRGERSPEVLTAQGQSHHRGHPRMTVTATEARPWTRSHHWASPSRNSPGHRPRDAGCNGSPSCAAATRPRSASSSTKNATSAVALLAVGRLRAVRGRPRSAGAAPAHSPPAATDHTPRRWEREGPRPRRHKPRRLRGPAPRLRHSSAAWTRSGSANRTARCSGMPTAVRPRRRDGSEKRRRGPGPAYRAYAR